MVKALGEAGLWIGAGLTNRQGRHINYPQGTPMPGPWSALEQEIFGNYQLGQHSMHELSGSLAPLTYTHTHTLTHTHSHSHTHSHTLTHTHTQTLTLTHTHTHSP